jgi:hypothetical protein
MLVRRPILLALECMSVLAFAASLLGVLMFIGAEAPEQALSRGLGVVPSGCEAGFYEGGRCVCWYRWSAHPVLFAFNIAMLLASFAAMTLLLRMQMRRSALFGSMGRRDGSA